MFALNGVSKRKIPLRDSPLIIATDQARILILHPGALNGTYSGTVHPFA